MISSTGRYINSSITEEGRYNSPLMDETGVYGLGGSVVPLLFIVPELYTPSCNAYVEYAIPFITLTPTISTPILYSQGFSFTDVDIATNTTLPKWPLFDGTRFITAGTQYINGSWEGRLHTSVDGVTWGEEANLINLYGAYPTAILLSESSLTWFGLVGSARTVAFGSFVPIVEQSTPVYCRVQLTAIVIENKVQHESINSVSTLDGNISYFKVVETELHATSKVHNERTLFKTEDTITTTPKKILTITETTKRFIMTEV